MVDINYINAFDDLKCIVSVVITIQKELLWDTLLKKEIQESKSFLCLF